MKRTAVLVIVLARICLARGRDREAKEALLALEVGAPNDSWVQASLARAYQRPMRARSATHRSGSVPSGSGVCTWTTISTVPLLPGTRLPRFQVATPPVCVQPPVQLT